MAIVMQLRWQGVTPEQYDAVREGVGWETNPPDGVSFTSRVSTTSRSASADVWESAAAFERFNEERLGPVTAAVGIQGEPAVEILPAHRIFDPMSGKAWS